MDSKTLYNFIDKHRKIKYDTKTKIANQMNMKKQVYDNYMKRLKANNPAHPFNRVCYYLDKLGYDLKIIKKTN